jgi:exodeoxyribonuclease-3
MNSRLRIASFNANSIRNRLQIILDWMSANQADVVCVQETKVRDEEFPIDPIAGAGYHVAFTGQKAYNGVAIISRHPIEQPVIGTGISEWDEEARIIRASINGVTIVNTYIPQGTDVTSPKFDYKLAWIQNMRDYFDNALTPDKPVVWVGDFNVAREPIDVYDPEALLGCVCYHPKEHAALDYVMDWGFVDVFRKHHMGEPNQFTFWDYRVPNALKRRIGWRLDHIWATKPLAEKSITSWVDTAPRMTEKPSDHTFIAADFDLG